MGKISEKLSAIQGEIRVNKSLYNSFGKYAYRNFESICEAAKPLMQKHKCSLTVSDEVVSVGSRIYIKATATLTDNESGESVSSTAFAREPEARKGMSEEQITGSASSYARKYAASGLLLLDDNKDADTNECQTAQGNAPKQSQQAQSQQNSGEAQNLALTLEQWISTGILKGDGLKKAQGYIAAKDIEGMRRTITWCVSQKSA